MQIRVVSWIRRVGLAVLAALAALIVAILCGAVPAPWKSASAAASPSETRQEAKVELVPGKPHTLFVPEDVRKSLGIRTATEDVLAVAQAPTHARTLELAGSTALDPGRILRIRIRFAPADVVKVGDTEDPVAWAKEGKTVYRELSPGDRVRKGDLLAVVYSVDVGNKKNDLIDALLQLKLDLDILKRAEDAAGSGAIPEVFVLNARRNVEGDRSAVMRAENTLRLWAISDKDIQDVRNEAQEILKRGGKRDPEKDKLWPRVELRAPVEGTIVERNVAERETIVDNTVNLFQIANVDRLLVLGNCPEDDLPILEGLRGTERQWRVETIGAKDAEAIDGPIEEVGYLIDPNQHTAVIKGYIPNPGRKIRAGQFVTATVRIPPPKNKQGVVEVVEIPIDAVVDDGRQSVVFVQDRKEKDHYTMRRVEVVDSFDRTAFVRCLPIPKEKQRTRAEEKQGLLPREPLMEGEHVLQSGVVELKAVLLDLEPSQSSEPSEDKDR
jgi:cobalt-zinc-cadmium efflux system membrane fusion protein